MYLKKPCLGAGSRVTAGGVWLHCMTLQRTSEFSHKVPKHCQIAWWFLAPQGLSSTAFSGTCIEPSDPSGKVPQGVIPGPQALGRKGGGGD